MESKTLKSGSKVVKTTRKPPNAGKGRQKGVPNKATANAREAIALFCETNVPNMQKWLNDIAEKQGSYMAFKCTLDRMEYYVPKLARTEMIGDAEKPIVHIYKWQDD